MDKYGRHRVREEDVVSYSQYPKVFEEYMEMQSKYGKITRLPTNNFLAPMGVGATAQWDGNSVTLKGISPLTDGKFNVTFDVNGKPHTVAVAPLKKGQQPFVLAQKGGHSHTVEEVKSEKADKSNPRHVAAPMPGRIQDIKVKPGAVVKKGEPVIILNSMKMETVIGAPSSGTVKRVTCIQDANVASGDLLLEME